jgi:23S rRNA (cytidine2498-2'-O)-methyltransferase
MPPKFVFTVCRPGAEAALKDEITARHAAWRFAFSRPGFVTFRLPDDAAEPALKSTFARAWGVSLGKVADADEAMRVREAWRAFAAALPPAELAECAHLHVWARDRALPGDLGFDTAAAAADAALGARLLAARPALASGEWAPLSNACAAPGEHVLDCVLVEPGEWWLGRHRATAPETRWPGGVPPLTVPADMISRAYLKIEEALAWSELPLRAGDAVVEIGSAPGGIAQALLARGCTVTGIDPAEMDARVLANPRFTHWRARAKDLKRGAFRDFRWLVSDANVAPNYTLDTVEAIVAHAGVEIEGLVLTLKLTDPKYAAALPRYAQRIRGWGYAEVRERQLAYNRQELCVVATRAAGAPKA